MQSTGRVEPSHLASLQMKTSHIRNFCILAHVDHGKTTLSDSLVCSNGVISPKLAGKIRFLDSTEEEQRRGITMHTSAIALLFRLEDKGQKSDGKESESKDDEYLINLVDSPGHIDFSSDVSTATRLCDGALIVVDVLEGLCTQTHAVLYKALKERMKPCLVLNKLDRLAVELKLTPTEAFSHLRRIVENVNALAFSLLTSEFRLIAELQGLYPNIEIDEDNPFVQDWNFSPEKGNVIFASAIDSWGFSTTKFANIWAKKMGVNKAVLQKYFFEYYSFNTKTMKIIKCDPTDSAAKPMFATMILEPIWQIYEAAVISQDPEKAAKMAQRGLNIDIPPREINTRDPRSTAQAIFRRWLPLPDALLRMVVRAMPSPDQSQRNRITNLIPDPNQSNITIPSINNELRESTVRKMISVYRDIESCSVDEQKAEVTVFISKMTPIRAGDLSPQDITMLRDRKMLIESTLESASQENDFDSSTEVFMALGRVFSGVLTRDKDLYILGNRHDPLVLDQESIQQLQATDLLSNENDKNESNMGESTLTSVKKLPAGSFGLYICLGPSAYPVDKAYSGNIVGIVGLESHVFKSGTLCSTWATCPMKAITFQAKPMVRVALEPTSHFDLPKLEKGLRSLYQYDPVVEVGLDDNGQHTMTCLGELHLELCLKTLIDKFAKCDIKASEPLVSFRETVIFEEQSIADTTKDRKLDEKNNKSRNKKMQAATNGIETAMPSETSSIALPPPWKDIPRIESSKDGRCRMIVQSNNLSITFRCFPCPESFASTIENDPQQATVLSDFIASKETVSSSPSQRSTIHSIWSKFHHALTDFEGVGSLDSVLKSSDKEGYDVLDRLLSLGPKNIGSNILLFDSNVKINLYSSNLSTDSKDSENILLSTLTMKDDSLFVKLWSKIQSAVFAGFQEVANSGPIMAEPLHAVGYSIEVIEYCFDAIYSSLSGDDISRLPLNHSDANQIIDQKALNPSITSNMIMMGQVISAVQDTLRLCMLSCSMRVVEPIYVCEIQCDQSQLGNLYSVLARRRGEVTKEDIIDGTSLFLLSAILPVNESFGFAQELLNKTSGAATAPQLRFSHWKQMDMDPFWRAKTEDELEEFGEQNNELNKVRILVDKIRKRKGLPIEEKVVAFAEKQRTLRK